MNIQKSSTDECMSLKIKVMIITVNWRITEIFSI